MNLKVVVFGSAKRVGLLLNGRILDLAQAAREVPSATACGAETFTTLLSVIEGGERAIEQMATLAETTREDAREGVWHDASTTTLHAPWTERRLFMTGGNHPQHLAGFFTSFGEPRTAQEAREIQRKRTIPGFWAVSDPIGPDADLVMPERANGLLDFEVEPGIVLGRPTKRITADAYRDCIWGTTIIADWSVREGTWPMTPPLPHILDKNFDGSKSIGPCIVVGGLDPQRIDLTTHVNGVLRQSFNTAEMIFGFGEILEFLSRDLTLRPGDMLSGGTGAGTAIDQTKVTDHKNWPRDLYLKPGDTVTMASPQIGSFDTHIVAGD